ncbi:MAG TPA: hypothetical protein VNW30_08315, partial [Opitutaceae bacterium]|nr:hypothetical protein [Opitutaceae bacterium]
PNEKFLQELQAQPYHISFAFTGACSLYAAMPTLRFIGRFFATALFCLTVSVRADTATEPKPEPTANGNADVAVKEKPAPAVEAKPEPLVDDAGRFVVSLPKPVQRGSQPVDTAVGKIAMNMVYYDGGATAYMIIYCDYPAGSVAQSGGPEKVCANASDGAVKSVNGTIRTTSSCQLGDVKGLEIVADIPPKDPKDSASASVARLRFFVVGDRLYQVMYIGPTGTETRPKAVDFLDSFRLTR